MHLACAANRRGRGLGQAEIPHFAFLDQLRHRADGVFDRRVGIDAMLIEKIDRVDAEPLEAGFACGAKILGTAVDFAARWIRRRAHDAELGRDYELVSAPANRAADQLLVAMRPVGVGRVPERDAEFERALEGVHRLRVVARPVEIRHAHTSEAERRYLQSASAKFPGFHFFSLLRVARSSTASANSFDSVRLDALESRQSHLCDTARSATFASSILPTSSRVPTRRSCWQTWARTSSRSSRRGVKVDASWGRIARESKSAGACSRF